MPEQSVVGMYDTMAHVEGALRKLDEAGFPIAHVSIVSQNLQSEREVVGYITVEDVAKKVSSLGSRTCPQHPARCRSDSAAGARRGECLESA